MGVEGMVSPAPAPLLRCAREKSSGSGDDTGRNAASAFSRGIARGAAAAPAAVAPTALEAARMGRRSMVGWWSGGGIGRGVCCEMG